MDTKLKLGFLAKVIIPVAALLLLGALLTAQISLEDLSRRWFSKEDTFTPHLTNDHSDTSTIQLESSTLEFSGLESLSSGDPSAAVSILEEASQVSNLSSEGWMGLGDAYLQLGEFRNALGAWQNLPPSQELLFKLTGAYYQLDDFEGLLFHMRKLLTQYPGEASLYYHTGLVYAAVRPDSSIAFLEQAASIDPTYKESSSKIIRTIKTARLLDEPAYTFVSVGRELAHANQWVLALEAFRQALSVREDYAEAWAFYGEALQQVNSQINEEMMEASTDTSLNALQKAVHLDSESLAAHIFLSLYWQRQGEYEEAIAVLETAALLEAENPIVWAEIGSCWAKAGDLLKAQTYLQKAIELAPDDPFFWRLMAEFSIFHQVQIRDLGLPAARQAVILDPKSSENLTLLGRALYFLGDHSNAARSLEDALDIDPFYAPAYLHLGMNYMAQGKTSQARDYFVQAASFGDGSPTADQARRLLENHFP